MGGHLRGSDIIGTAGRHQPHWHAVQLYNETTRYKFIWSFSQSSTTKTKDKFIWGFSQKLYNTSTTKQNFFRLYNKCTTKRNMRTLFTTLPYNNLLFTGIFRTSWTTVIQQWQVQYTWQLLKKINVRNKDSEDETFCVCTFVNSPLTKKTKKKNKP